MFHQRTSNSQEVDPEAEVEDGDNVPIQDDGLDSSESVKNKKFVYTKFYRLRKVRLINGKYMTCSCGYPKRMKSPCVHIMRVTGVRLPLMYHVRWWMLFQYHFMKVGGNETSKIMTDHFHKMLAKESHRRRDEDICVEDWLNSKVPPTESVSYPKLCEGTIEEDRVFAMRLHRCQILNMPVARCNLTGEAKLPRQIFPELNLRDDDSNSQRPSAVADMSVQVHLTQASQNMLTQMTEATKATQLASVPETVSMSDKEHFNHAMTLCKDTYLKYLSTRKEREEFVTYINDFQLSKVSSLATSCDEGTVASSGNPKRAPRTSFPPTTLSKSRSNKRIKGSHEKGGKKQTQIH